MKTIQRIRMIALLSTVVAVALGFSPSPVRAQSAWMTVTNCEMVTIEGQEYGKLTFDIHNVFMHFNQPIVGISVRPAAPAQDDTCSVLRMTMPAGWRLESTSSPGIWIWSAIGGWILPGESITGIQVVLSQPVCCYDFTIHGALLIDDPGVTACLACPGVTPAAESTWGRIKQTYR
jgi:hypothetical protein